MAKIADVVPRMRFVNGPFAGKTVPEVRKELRRSGVKVNEAAANEVLAEAFNVCEAQGLPLVAVVYGADGPEVYELEIVNDGQEVES